MTKIPKLKILFLLSTFYFLFSVNSVWAAQLNFISQIQEISINQQFQIDLVLDTENEEINAVEGKIVLPENLLEVKEIRDGNSIINFWIERPKAKSDNQIIFSGIVPGGYIGENGLIFSAIFQSKNEGEGIIEIQQAKALLNDGKGTEAKTKISNFQFSIFKEKMPLEVPLLEIKDTDPPEDFKPEVASDPNIFEGRWFLVFATQDKGTGIDHYEILEKSQRGSLQRLLREEKWQVGESPYLLKDQKLKSYIYVKVIDKAGNERIATLPPQNPLKWYENYFVWLAILITIIIAYIIWRFLKRFHFLTLFLLSITLAIVSLAVPISVFAASLYLSPATGSYNVGQSFSVSVYVSSADQAMNAVSGVISFPSDKLEVTSLSKNVSIFSLWVQEPTFSNSAGTVTFEGIVLNPGFTGSAGKIISVNFKTKAVGNVPLTFSSGSVLANDGKGTNILASMSSGSYVIEPKTITPPVEEYVPPKNIPAAPVISSPTHPDSEKWYSNNDPKFIWEVPEDVTGAKLLVGHKPVAIPTVFYSEPISKKQLEDLADGIWYFHVQLRNASGWGEISHFRFQIDTQPPEPFAIKFIDGTKTENPKPTVIFDTTDSLSGVDYYKTKIGEGDFFSITSEIVEKNLYTLPLQNPGKRSILIQAFDKAGNYTIAVEEFEILSIKPPSITEYPKELQSGEPLIVRGSTYSNSKVTIWLQREKDDPKSFTVESDQDGNFTFTADEKLGDGIYRLWAEVVDARGARSLPSEKITITIAKPAILRVGSWAVSLLAVVVPLVALIFILLFIIWYGWHKFSSFRKKIRKETKETKEALHQAFKALKEETEEQIAKLDGKPDLSEREKKICNDLKKALKISEEFIGKEIEDIEKEIKK